MQHSPPGSATVATCQTRPSVEYSTSRSTASPSGSLMMKWIGTSPLRVPSGWRTMTEGGVTVVGVKSVARKLETLPKRSVIPMACRFMLVPGRVWPVSRVISK